MSHYALVHTLMWITDLQLVPSHCDCPVNYCQMLPYTQLSEKEMERGRIGVEITIAVTTTQMYGQCCQ